ncbi:glycosyltransferase [Alkalihalophilus marmarensis]|uniref:glycosyltransferase n=1 Tax=Alkalihalophilus marmarensis TaxID=521377 RepID=UPI002E1D494B|nr:glycosyltransferase [Alkalihalophilus marmarensis]MED1603614.1 glycosyltransferase [Alkalihalophilus marmarensis]
MKGRAMKHILMLLFKDIHYDARVQREAIALAEAGYQVTITCLKEYDFPPDDLHEKIIVHRISITSKKIRGSISTSPESKQRLSLKSLLFRVVRTPVIKVLKDRWAFNEFYKKVRDYIDKEKLSIHAVHAHDLNTLSAGYKLANLHKSKLIYDSHELFNEMSGRNELDRKVGYREEGKLIEKIDSLIVVNPYIANLFEQRYGKLSTTIIQNIPLVELGEELDEAPHNNYWRETYKLTDDDIILLYQGGINPERGLEECIEALTLLPSIYKLVLLGDGRLKNKLIESAKEHQLDDRVFFHKQVPAAHVHWYTKQADVGLVMYRNLSKNNYYSSPNKIFEYLLAGIPTVASDHPGKNYLIKKEETGVCIEETPEAIKDGVLHVISHYEEIKKTCLIKRHNYTWEKEQQKLIQMYDKLLKA